LAKAHLEEEKADHARTQRGIVDQQKLIASHLEKNSKLELRITEQRDQIVKLETRLNELEAAGSKAMSVLSYQSEITRLTQERDSSKILLQQKTNDYQKLANMLMDYEEKLRNQESNAAGARELSELRAERDRFAAEAKEAKEWVDKYQSTLSENRKLEKRIGSLESKNVFLKKKIEKLETAK
jgi:predicted  nucleic acid-binding Zn-ribbon protein